MSALEYSHRSGIVHRDIKPGNVMITPDGSIKVMDFGIARAVAQSTATVTQTAAVMGTAQYLSPEQARGEKVDARSDLYSAGVVLYELLTGEPPFRGDSPVAVAYQHVREEPTPPSDIERDLSPSVDAVVMKALAKNPGNRYQTASEFSDDLGRLLTGRKVFATPLLREPASRPPVPKRRPRRRPSRRAMLVTAVLLILAAGAVVGGLRLAQGPKSDAKVAVPPVRGYLLGAAKKLITDNGFRVKTTPVKNAAPVDTVLGSKPVVGTKLAKNSVVTLTYSTGPSTQPIPPDLVGLEPAVAEQQLRTLGFRTSETSVQAPGIPPGRVASTSPTGGSKADPRTVTVVIKVANNETTVPGVVGLSADVARSQLSNSDLQVEAVTADSTQSGGQVIAQSLMGETTVDRGTLVTITVTRFVTPPPPPPPSPTPTQTPSAKPTKTPTPKPTPSPSASVQPSPSATASPAPSATSGGLPPR